MKMILFLSLLTTLLMAKNPYAYSVIGDRIYDNVEDIVKLKNIAQYKQEKEKINSYYFDVNLLKHMGFKLDSNDKNIDKKEYLTSLRTLVIMNDYFIRSAYDNFEISMENEDSKLFSDIINTGIIDTDRYKKEILQYYKAHLDSTNPRGVIQRFIDEDNRLKEKNKLKKQVPKDLKKLQIEKMKRLIAKDKEDQILLEKCLEDELIKRKQEIQKESNRTHI